jgi:hypothetical protein
MEDNPYQVGAAVGPSGEPVDARPRRPRAFELIGQSKIAEACFESLLILGTVFFVLMAGRSAFRQMQDNRLLQVSLIERLVVLPGLVLLSVWVARGLLRLRRRAVLVQATLSILVACWALFLTWRNWFDLQDAIAELGPYPVVAARDIGLFITRFCSGIVHLLVARELLGARKPLARPEAEIIAKPSSNRFGLSSYLLAAACGFALAYGTIGTANALVLEAAKNYFARQAGV